MNDEWFYRLNGKQVGPFYRLVLLQMIEYGVVASNTEVWRGDSV
ncbi:MAG: DUF4339 domain-containing protein [Ignavibacteria bacterium]|nr:DUF4339 domain-containing protein [Ignavibacteria bacterium]